MVYEDPVNREPDEARSGIWHTMLPPSELNEEPRSWNSQNSITREDLAGYRVATDQPIRVEGVYVISVVARLLDMHPQTLRKYERIGMVSPSRTIGMLRLYSDEDLSRLRLIKHLVDDLGLNLAGVEMALGLIHRLKVMRQDLSRLQGRDRIREATMRGLQRLQELLNLPSGGPV